MKINLIVAKLDMGKPPFEASEGGLFEVLRLWKDFTPSEPHFRKGMAEMLRQKVRPCLRRSGYAQAGRSLSERLTHVHIEKCL
jgi:hypothetical protein